MQRKPQELYLKIQNAKKQDQHEIDGNDAIRSCKENSEKRASVTRSR